VQTSAPELLQDLAIRKMVGALETRRSSRRALSTCSRSAIETAFCIRGSALRRSASRLPGCPTRRLHSEEAPLVEEHVHSLREARGRRREACIQVGSRSSLHSPLSARNEAEDFAIRKKPDVNAGLSQESLEFLVWSRRPSFVVGAPLEVGVPLAGDAHEKNECLLVFHRTHRKARRRTSPPSRCTLRARESAPARPGTRRTTRGMSRKNARDRARLGPCRPAP